VRRALNRFPDRDAADAVYERFFIEGGIEPNRPFKAKPIFTYPLTEAVTKLLMVANFVEVFLAKEGHRGVVGINLLEKIQMPTLPSLLGAMLAGVDFVLMGAGIPRAIPGVLDMLSAGDEATMPLTVTGASEEFRVRLSPRGLLPEVRFPLRRPKFLAIVASSVLATTLARKGNPPPDGFVLELPSAGGHNAPPRGALQLDASGQPIYGPRDAPSFGELQETGLPFWLAGSFGKPGMLERAIALGAQGIQVGTAFAFCDESGIDPNLKATILNLSARDSAHTFTDPKASPTGFPFKLVDVEGTLSDRAVYEGRSRVCDLGYLRQLYERPDGKIGFRCPAEPVEDFIAKGGEASDTVDRKCLCNGLVATIGLGQRHKDGTVEPAMVTAGDDVRNVSAFVPFGRRSYSAADVLDMLLAPNSEGND
jgi:nitronate monooxygenase